VAESVGNAVSASKLGERVDDFMDAAGPWVYRLGFVLGIGGFCVWAIGAACFVVLLAVLVVLLTAAVI
jgi:hypothetical protein